jgi:hypothetical protein
MAFLGKPINHRLGIGCYVYLGAHAMYALIPYFLGLNDQHGRIALSLFGQHPSHFSECSLRATVDVL